MAYRKTISTSLLSHSGVTEACDAMTEALKRIEEEPREFMDLLGSKIVEELSSHYPASQVTVEKTAPEGNSGSYSMTVKASGDRLLFIEFGTGFPADESMGLSFGFGAGSWSETHADTFSQWLASGADPDDYPYNNAGVDAFWEVEKKLRGIIKETAEEVFGRWLI